MYWFFFPQDPLPKRILIIKLDKIIKPDQDQYKDFGPAILKVIFMVGQVSKSRAPFPNSAVGKNPEFCQFDP